MSTSVPSRKRAIVYLLIAALLWSSGGLLIKLIEWNGLAISGARSLIAAITLVILIKKPSINLSRNQLLGSLAYALTVALFVMANKLTTAANSILLQYTAPIYIIILGPYVLGERNTARDYLSVLAVAIGMLLFFMDDLLPGNLTGNIYAILSGVSFGVMALFLRLQKNSSPTESIIIGNIIVFAVSIPFMMDGMPSYRDLLLLFVLGIFQLGFSYYLYTKAIRSVTALDAILIPTIEPILNPIWVFLVIGERPGIWAIIGGSLVIVAVLVRSLYSQRPDLPTT